MTIYMISYSICKRLASPKGKTIVDRGKKTGGIDVRKPFQLAKNLVCACTDIADQEDTLISKLIITPIEHIAITVKAYALFLSEETLPSQSGGLETRVFASGSHGDNGAPCLIICVYT